MALLLELLLHHHLHLNFSLMLSLGGHHIWEAHTFFVFSFWLIVHLRSRELILHHLLVLLCSCWDLVVTFICLFCGWLHYVRDLLTHLLLPSFVFLLLPFCVLCRLQPN